MPIYEYRCGKCGHHMEVLQKFSDPPARSCEICKGKVKKLISQSAFHLKGTGWYVTDYASKNMDSQSTSEKPKEETKIKDTTNKAENPKKETSATSDKKKKD